MANIDHPFGFRAVNTGTAGTVPRLTEYTALTNIAIYEGDIVALNTTGLVIAYTTADADSGDVIGVAAHTLTAAMTARELLVYDDPEQIFEAQVDDDTVASNAGWLFQYFAVTATTGNTTTLQSKHEIDGDTGTNLAATTMAVQIVGLSKAINNAANLSVTRYLCRILPQAHIRSSMAADSGTHVGGIA
jgi:hypothetical protein